MKEWWETHTWEDYYNLFQVQRNLTHGDAARQLGICSWHSNMRRRTVCKAFYLAIFLDTRVPLCQECTMLLRREAEASPTMWPELIRVETFIPEDINALHRP